MGCATEKPTADTRPLMVRYSELKLNMPFSTDTENGFEKDIFFAINMLRHNPRGFIPHVQRVHQKNLCKGSKSMGAIIEVLKNMQKVSTVKFDDEANRAVRENNDAICQRAEDSPEEGGNQAKLNEITGREPCGGEASIYNYSGNSAEELIAILLYKDFDKYAALEQKPEASEGETGLESPLLNSRTIKIGVSNKAHSKCLNSIQIVYIYSLVNKLNDDAAGAKDNGDGHAMM